MQKIISSSDAFFLGGELRIYDHSNRTEKNYMDSSGVELSLSTILRDRGFPVSISRGNQGKIFEFNFFLTFLEKNDGK